MTEQVQTSDFKFSLGDDLWLRGNVHTLVNQQNKPTLVLCHGFKGFKDWGFFPYIADRLAQQGYYVVRFNFSCNGVGQTDFDELEKFAVNTYSREQADLLALMNHIKNKDLPFAQESHSKQIALLGHSRGGGNSLIFAADQPEISCVVTWNGIANVDLFDDQLKKEIHEKGVGYIANARTKQDMPIRSIVLDDMALHQQRFNITDRIRSYPNPILVIQGDKDVPRLVDGAQKLNTAAPHSQLVIIEGGNHTFGAVHPFQGTTSFLEEALSVTINFLEQNLT
ncbi:S9 family peptidase [Ammoniphilus sp. YIM 78166]|uniref:alpha/beta hydrolase family protein n=1 Tax=Ammoniphilus sp. YIM 78166 TaxID=1644106 RepID=UPI00106F678F|nr:alpha/beta hydrolase [Ammoniphilus sp. YIM 78166]